MVVLRRKSFKTKKLQTRMHSSSMRTVRSSGRISGGGGPGPGGVYLVLGGGTWSGGVTGPGGVSAPGGTWSWGVSALGGVSGPEGCVPGPGGVFAPGGTWSWGVSALGVYLVPGGVYLVWGGCLLWGVYTPGVSAPRGCTWSGTPPLWIDRCL